MLGSIRQVPGGYFQVDLYNLVAMNCDLVYNFVLEREHSVLINGIPCATVGQGVIPGIRDLLEPN